MVLLLAFLAALVTPSGGLPTAEEALRNGVARDCQHHSPVRHQPRELRSLDALSGPIRDKLVSHLKARLGDTFYDRLQFRRGLEFDRSEVGSGDGEAKVPAYHFEFVLSLPEAGVKEYCAETDLSPHGKVTKEIDLPEVARDPQKATIVPLPDALLVATREGVSSEKALVELGYDASRGCIVWLISYSEKKESGETILLSLSINAHTGQKIIWYAQDIRYHKPA